MSVTRGASPYLSSEQRGHCAFVSSRNLVEVGNKRRKIWRKRWFADTANFSSMADIYSVVKVQHLESLRRVDPFCRRNLLLVSRIVHFAGVLCGLGETMQSTETSFCKEITWVQHLESHWRVDSSCWTEWLLAARIAHCAGVLCELGEPCKASL